MIHPEPKTETIRGVVRRIRFWNQNNGFCILVTETKNGPCVCKGHLPAIRQDEEYEFTGVWVNDPKWGLQFWFSRAEVMLPGTIEGAVRYLASLANGVGPATARKIVDALGGDQALPAILETPEKLYSLKFLKPEQAEEIVAALTQNTVLAELSSLVCRDGIGPATAAKIYAQYGQEAVRQVRQNPYIIADDVFGIGFKKADAIARGLGVPADSPYRIEAAYTYMLREATGEGHVYLTPNETIPRIKTLLGDAAVEVENIAQACRALQERGAVVREQIDSKKSAIYHADLYRAEVELARHIRRILQAPLQEWAGIEALIAAQENDMKIEYAAQQKIAVATALANPLSVITGGPGTGKSTVTKAICNIYAERYPHRPIYLASPTGKAAKRLEEATGREAKTIHRLLRFHPEYGFQYDESNPLPGPGLLIVDEVSMMDVELAAGFFAAIDTGMTVVLVGDIDQLPSVGPGCVLRDVIESGVVPTVRLQFNYRQAGGSKIAEYAHWVVSGNVPPVAIQDGDYDCRLCETPEEALEQIRAEIAAALARGMTAMDFQVLAPQKRGSVGVAALNDMVREMVNPPREDRAELRYGKDTTYRVLDKVMVTKNDYQLGVFNGDMGVVRDVQGDKLVVDIDGWEFVFPHEKLNLLTHAYAITIHKSQGSEWPLAIVVCHSQSWIMLQRNLLYTAITRAKNRLVLLTNQRALKQAVSNDRQTERLSLLKQRLKGEI